ncbi:hypothetical protein KY346_05785 [Candidatus Woesearchaeota archaeon]|nr:hypothetical protein [Candidatus Woesearchaeota archaeon]
MKKLVYPIMLVLLSTFALAQSTGLMHYSGKGSGLDLMMFVYWAVMAAIFSIIFWLTYKWLIKNKK